MRHEGTSLIVVRPCCLIVLAMLAGQARAGGFATITDSITLPPSNVRGRGTNNIMTLSVEASL